MDFLLLLGFNAVLQMAASRLRPEVEPGEVDACVERVALMPGEAQSLGFEYERHRGWLRTDCLPRVDMVLTWGGRPFEMSDAVNCMVGSVRGLPVGVADCFLHSRWLTVFFFRRPRWLPQLTLEPRGSRSLSVPHGLNRRLPRSFRSLYRVTAGHDETALRALRPDVMAWLEVFTGWSVAVEGDWLLVHRGLLLETMQPALEQAWMLVDLLGSAQSGQP